MSDHLPILTLLRQTKLNNNMLLIFESRNLNDKNIKLINNALQKIDWYSKLSGSNCNENYNKFTTLLKTTMNEISPLKKYAYQAKEDILSPG